MFKKLEEMLGLDKMKKDISSIRKSIFDLKHSIDDYNSNRINDLIAENTKLKEENSIYLKYYDIDSQATDEIKKQVFTEFEALRLQKTNEKLEAQVDYLKKIAIAASNRYMDRVAIN